MNSVTELDVSMTGQPQDCAFPLDRLVSIANLDQHWFTERSYYSNKQRKFWYHLSCVDGSKGTESRVTNPLTQRHQGS